MYTKREREVVFRADGYTYEYPLPPSLEDLEDQLDSIGEMLNVLMEDREHAIECSKIIADSL